MWKNQQRCGVSHLLQPSTVQSGISRIPTLILAQTQQCSQGAHQVLVWGCWSKPQAQGIHMGTVPSVLLSTHLLPVQHDPQAGLLPERQGRSCPAHSPFSLPYLWAQLLPCCASLCLAPSLALAKRWGHAQRINMLNLCSRHG